ncbi:MAG TPA: hypothetical protein VFS81_13575 [Candidatus Binatia bacterium]|nr:hypothetical protein [Candidatus Binatia bacterium]
MNDTFNAVYAHWLNNPEDFWGRGGPSGSLGEKVGPGAPDSRPPFYRWLPGGLVKSLVFRHLKFLWSPRSYETALPRCRTRTR